LARTRSAVCGFALLCAALYGITGPGFAQSPQPQVQSPQSQSQASAPAAALKPASRAVSARNTASAPKPNGKQVTKPLWNELTPAQQQALAPLSGKWDTVSEAQKRKWLALSQNFPKMSGAEQEKLHSRMSEWVGLSPQQRTQARLGFGETQRLAVDDKKAKWEAYQALSPEEKRKLAASAPRAPATAAAVKPVAPEKLAGIPKPRRVANTPRIAAAPGQVDHNTLLPQRASPPVRPPPAAVQPPPVSVQQPPAVPPPAAATPTN
jgi:hypothetical protein